MADDDPDGDRLGRRERKKAATRTTISTAALHLFLEHGFDEVGIREIAQHADVAVATIFAHFSGKEALVFDENEQTIRSLIDAVSGRADGVDALQALQDWSARLHEALLAREDNDDFTRLRRLVDDTPALLEYWKNSWRRSVPLLAEAIATTSRIPPRSARLIATLAIEGYLLATQDAQPESAFDELFLGLREGLPATPRR